jgi:hypothetical protein
MAVYLCRWPNGEFSIVSARTKADAIVALDEVGNADCAQIWKIETCLIDFRLNDEGGFEVNDFGEETRDIVMGRCYPELEEAISNAETDDQKGYFTERGYSQIRNAVEHERKRLQDNRPQGREAATEIGREIQRTMDTPRVVANRLVKRVARERLKSREGEGGKPN